MTSTSRARGGFAKTPLALAVGLLNFGFSPLLQAQEAQVAEAPNTIERVEVTGSSIKRAASTQALPVTIVKAEDYLAQGMLNVTDILMSMPTNTDFLAATVSGAPHAANMRGIGAARTLVLLDGKRLNDTTANVDLIPISALDRTETLRDGASSIYGSDAIGGVINFVTKKSLVGGSIMAKISQPEKAGGESRGYGFSYGRGNLAADGWNVYITGDVERQFPIAYDQRPDITSLERRASAGIAPPSITKGSAAVPANIIQVDGKNVSTLGSPGYAAGCLAPYSVQGTSNTCTSTATANNLSLLIERQKATFYTKGTIDLGNDHQITADLMYGEMFTRPVKAATLSKAPAGTPAMIITPSSPYYPGKGITPAVAGLKGTEALTLNWSLQGDLGPTVLNYRETNTRASVRDEGRIGDWDYRLGISHLVYTANQSFRSGFVNSVLLIKGVKDGILNPFALQGTAGKAYLDSISTNGEIAVNNITRLSGLDLALNRELMPLAGGALAVAAGASLYHDYTHMVVPPSVELSTGATGTNTVYFNQGASRNIAAGYVELDAPVTKALDLNFSVRTDHYSDFGNTTNPKISLKYQPIDMFMVRAAVGTGFRAPTLQNRYFGAVNGPTGLTSATTNDPLLCPGVGSAAVALPGYSTGTVCNTKLPINAGANPNVGPETSKTFTLGFVFTPTRALLMSVDLYDIRVDKAIGKISEASILSDPRYASLFIRDANKNLLYIDDRTSNLGGQRTSGADVSLSYAFPKTSVGAFSTQFDGNYVHSFETQLEDDGPWISSVNKFSPSDANAMTFKWRYGASIKWVSNDGKWTSTLNQQYKQSFQDLNATGTLFNHRIDSYTAYNLSLAYDGFKSLSLYAGITNLLDRLPPAANYRGEGFASGTATAVGRAINLRATYKFN